MLRGKDGIRQAFTELLGEIPQATWDLKTTIYEDDILFLEWDAEGGGNRAEGCRPCGAGCTCQTGATEPV